MEISDDICVILSDNEESAPAVVLTRFKHRVKKRNGQPQSFFDADDADYTDLIAIGYTEAKLKRLREIGLGASRYFVCFALALCSLWLLPMLSTQRERGAEARRENGILSGN